QVLAADDVEHGPARPRLRIPRGIHELRDARVHERPGAHRARLERHVHRGARQAIVPDPLRGDPERANLRMRGRVAVADRLVGGLREQRAVGGHEDGADRHLAALAHLARERERAAHPSRRIAGRRPLAVCREARSAAHAAGPRRSRRHSHSMVAGGFPEMSYTTREIPSTSLMIRRATRSWNSAGRRAPRAVTKSTVWTARSATT